MTAFRPLRPSEGRSADRLHVTVERSIQFVSANWLRAFSFRRNLLQPVSRFVVSIGGSDVLVVPLHVRLRLDTKYSASTGN